jgi:hypothetical protein
MRENDEGSAFRFSRQAFSETGFGGWANFRERDLSRLGGERNAEGSSTRKSVYLVHEGPNENNTSEIIHCDFQPKPIGFFGAVNPTMKADPRLARTRPDHSRREEDDR